MTFDAAPTDFILRQCKTRMKKMAAQVNFCLPLNVFFCLACNTVSENWHICVNKGLTYLLKKGTITETAAYKACGSLGFIFWT